MEFLIIAICLLGIAANHALGFFAAAGNVRLGLAIKLCCAALGLNKILFVGTGYLVSAYFSRNRSLPASKVMAIFILLEVVFFSVWIGCGLYYGGRLLLTRAPYGLLIAAALLGAAAYVKRDKVLGLLRETPLRLAEMGRRLLWIPPLAFVNAALSLFYYQALFELFGYHATLKSILPVVSIALSAGYLSPAPGGLGFKDAGLAVLLIEQGVPAGSAIAIAFWDRVIITLFWAALGAVFAFDLIREEVARRRRRFRS